MPTAILEDIVKEALEKLDQIGLNVLIVMSDMGSNFHSFANRMGVTPDKPWFTHGNKTYFLMFDPPHLLKCVRSNLIKYTFKFGEYVAVWKDIEDFYAKDISLPIRAGPKLTEKRIRPNNFAKMRVKCANKCLATQWQLQFGLMLVWGVSLHLQWVLQNFFPDLIPFLTV